jgi:hypothetical protein
MKRQQITIGSIIRLSLPCNKFGYGRILKNASYAFYDLITEDEVESLDVVVNSPILFIIAVYNNAVNSGRWVKKGKLPLDDKLQELPYKFIQDELNPSVFELYNPNTGEIVRAEMKDCFDLERAAVWEAEHVEERLCDHYLGRKNKWVEDMRLKI